MATILGIDTSNYTTSCALYHGDTGEILKLGKLLPVKDGERGIRQSDAVFHHTQQLPDLICELLKDNNKIDAVCASATPRRQEGSYMPCFTVGHGTGRSIAASLNVPFYDVSHQEGHIMAALFSAKKMELLSQKFIAFHISGGTTEALLVTPHEKEILSALLVAKTLDLNAGQLIDRIGVMMGLSFPAGKEIERLALRYEGNHKVKSVLKEFDCCLSGFENKLSKLYRETNDKALVSSLVLEYVKVTIEDMTTRLLQKFGNLPVVYSGGVMSNSIIRNSLKSRFTCDFAEPSFSCDNAAGVAVLGHCKYTNGFRS